MLVLEILAVMQMEATGVWVYILTERRMSVAVDWLMLDRRTNNERMMYMDYHERQCA